MSVCIHFGVCSQREHHEVEVTDLGRVNRRPQAEEAAAALVRKGTALQAALVQEHLFTG